MDLLQGLLEDCREHIQHQRPPGYSKSWKYGASMGKTSNPYKDDEIVEVIRVTTSAIFMVTNLVTKHFGFEEDWKKVSQMFEEWGKH
jgi:hypothetical protein